MNMPKEIKGWVLYDGACGFCSWWIPFWGDLLANKGFAIEPLQTPWVKEKTGFTAEELSKDIRILFKDGHIVSGADAYLYIFQHIWWTAPIGYFFNLPVFKSLFWVAYRVFNINRFFVSRVCKMKPAIQIDSRQGK